VNRRKFVAGAVAGAVGIGIGAAQEKARARLDARATMGLGSVTYNLLKDLDIETVVRTLEAAGWGAVELRTGHKHGVEPSIGAEERRRVRDRFENSKVTLVGYGTTCRFQSPDADERFRELETAKSFVDLAHDTGAIGIKIQPMGFAPGVSSNTTVEYYGESLHALGDYGQAKGVEIWVEVHGKGTSEPAVAAGMMKSAAHKNVGLCWNSNATDIRNGDIRESFELLGPWIRNVHIHELAGDDYPYRKLFQLLRGSGYNRFTLAEIPESKEPFRFMRYYRALWTELCS
jgi:sugar phosphate isomerase/epimerase